VPTIPAHRGIMTTFARRKLRTVPKFQVYRGKPGVWNGEKQGLRTRTEGLREQKNRE